MSNPFDEPAAGYLVLVNNEEQYSLWPAFAEVPRGWSVAFGEATKAECLGYAERSWADPYLRFEKAPDTARDAR